jgi:hypothetical protein
MGSYITIKVLEKKKEQFMQLWYLPTYLPTYLVPTYSPLTLAPKYLLYHQHELVPYYYYYYYYTHFMLGIQ